MKTLIFFFMLHCLSQTAVTEVSFFSKRSSDPANVQININISYFYGFKLTHPHRIVIKRAVE